MRYISIFFVLFMLATFMAVSHADADTRYVGDQLIITLRQGKSTQHKILKTLETGTPVEVLEEDESYLKVKTSDGTEGYVLRQYISSSPPKSQRIDELEMEKSTLLKKIQALENARDSLETKYNLIQDKYDREVSEISAQSSDIALELEQALNNESSMAEKYNTLLAQSENVVEIAAERDRLLLENKNLAAEIKNLQKTTEKMADSRMIKWFLAGGGVFLFGWIIGKISRKKRSRF